MLPPRPLLEQGPRGWGQSGETRRPQAGTPRMGPAASFWASPNTWALLYMPCCRPQRQRRDRAWGPVAREPNVSRLNPAGCGGRTSRPGHLPPWAWERVFDLWDPVTVPTRWAPCGSRGSPGWVGRSVTSRQQEAGSPKALLTLQLPRSRSPSVGRPSLGLCLTLAGQRRGFQRARESPFRPLHSGSAGAILVAG